MYGLPGDVACFLRSQKDRQIGHIVWYRHAPKRHLASCSLQLLLRHAVARLGGVGSAGRDGVDTDTMPGQFQRCSAGEADDARLTRHVVYTARRTPESCP